MKAAARAGRPRPQDRPRPASLCRGEPRLGGCPVQREVPRPREMPRLRSRCRPPERAGRRARHAPSPGPLPGARERSSTPILSGEAATREAGETAITLSVVALYAIVHEISEHFEDLYAIEVLHMAFDPSKIRDSRDHISTDYLEWCDPIHAWPEPDHRLYAHAREPAQLPDQLLYLLTTLADVEGESTGLLYGIVVRALFLTVSAQYVELPGYLGARAQTAGVGVARNHAQRLLLPVAGDHDRRVGPAYALR